MENKDKKITLNPDIVLVGKRIEAIIKEKKLKTREVAHDANMDVENLRKYIKGKQEMKITTMLRIVKSLGINVSDLFPNK